MCVGILQLNLNKGQGFQNYSSLEHSHIAYQIKQDEKLKKCFDPVYRCFTFPDNSLCEIENFCMRYNSLRYCSRLTICDIVLCVFSQEYHGRTSDDNSSNSHAVSFVILCLICLSIYVCVCVTD